MSKGRKYYWLKLKRDFFKRHDIRIIEKMPNGKDYILFYLKMLLESIDHEGELRFSETIPYNEEMLSVITDTNVDMVRQAMKIFVELGMIEVLEDCTIYMNEVERMIGSASDNDNANRQRRFRERQKALALPERYDSVTKSNESKSIEKEIEIEKDINNIMTIVSYLNFKTGKTYRYQTPKTQKLIKARMSEGFTVDDFKTVIDKKCTDWLKTDMEKYLRPETLFGTKFEGYLNEKQGRNESHERNPGHHEPNRIGNYI